jgi:hypothetical protein
VGGLHAYNLSILEQRWNSFMDEQRTRPNPGRLAFIDKATGEARVSFSDKKYYRGHTFERDLGEYFGKVAVNAV